VRSPMPETALTKMLAMLLAQPPRRWTRTYINQIVQRANKRIEGLDDREDQLAAGRTAPAIDQVAIGAGRQFRLAVLFLDICGFSAWPSSDHAEQAVVLKVMNVFMAEMMNIARDFDGVFEKNTGDGLMAYFGTDASDEAAGVEVAVGAAVVMHYVNDALISPWLQREGLYPVRFRIGLDSGEVTIGRVGVPGGLSSFVAIGATANCACKIMRFIPEGGICIGNEVFKRLPPGWDRWCTPIASLTGFVYKLSGQPYPAWCLDYRLQQPTQ